MGDRQIRRHLQKSYRLSAPSCCSETTTVLLQLLNLTALPELSSNYGEHVETGREGGVEWRGKNGLPGNVKPGWTNATKEDPLN